MIYYIFKWMKTLLQTVSSFTSTLSCLIVFLFCLHFCSKPFRNNWIHCEITDCYFNIFFVEIQLKKNWKVLFGSQSLGIQTGIVVSQMTWICHWGAWVFEIFPKKGGGFRIYISKGGVGKIGGRLFPTGKMGSKSPPDY